MSKIISFRVSSEQMKEIQENANFFNRKSITEFSRFASVNFLACLVQLYYLGVEDVRNGRRKN